MTTPQWPAVPDAERTVESLCQEWHFVEAKLQRDVAAVPESPIGDDTHDDEVARLCTEANSRQREIEKAVAASERARSIGDVRGILSVVAKVMSRESLGEPRDRGMVAVALAWLNPVAERVPDAVVARAARELEGDVCDLFRMADIVLALEDEALGDVTTDAGSRLQLAIDLMHKEAREFRRKYYAAISPGQHPELDKAA